ncbi:sulfatase [Catenovulum maritimum]|uniref:Sulfatase n=1 Tax=Catenovulum maritimum TaxID=1513271 RepID=A0A0J8GPZ4_9ALTE|nr:sulfatase [Catenovulum maritimum]
MTGLTLFSTLLLANDQTLDKPNILWLVVEDMSPIIPDYGDHTVATPTISRLAKEGVKYTNVYSTSGVCSPSRAALALGMYPSAIGANHMRTTSDTETTKLPKYEAVPPADAKMLSQYMRELGYYTVNNLKTDYQFTPPNTAWDESGAYAHWRNRAEGQPFFAVFNFTTTHESGLFEPYGFRKIESRHYFSDDAERISKLPQHHSVKSTEAETPVHIAKTTDFKIPPYLPDTPLVRRDMWKMYNNLAETDKQMGSVLQQLIDDDLLENTIVFFYSDHGGPLPRQKRLIYDSGLKVPLIIRFPHKVNAGTTDDQLISFIDFAPTTLNIAGIKTPTNMHGQNFLDNANPRQYIHAAADRFDGFTDSIRAVKNKQYKYIRNYRPEQGYYLPVAYREKIPSMQELLRLKAENKLTEYQAQWFRESKPKEELFDTTKDPHELNNLAGQAKYQRIMTELSDEMDRWLASIGDNPNLPERSLISQLWQNADEKPKTAKPQVKTDHGMLEITTATPGANIGYRIIRNGYQATSWSIYKKPVQLKRGDQIEIIAHRIGYEKSEKISVTF